MAAKAQSSISHHLEVKAAWRIALGLLLLAAPIARGQFTYTTNNGTITITSYTGPAGAVTIPDSINGLPVTSIAAYVFPNENPTSVIVPGSVSSIAGYAFAYCSSLKSVYFLGNAPTFGTFAFYFDFSVTVYHLPGATGWVSDPGDSVSNVELAGIAVSATPSNGPVPLTVSFTSTNVDSADASVTAWNWIFGDGSTSASQNPSHTYTNSGTFSVTLLGINNLGIPIAGTNATVTVSATAPEFDVAFTAAPTTGYAPLTVDFSATNVDNFGNAITSWNWNFGDGTTSILQNPVHTYTTNGNFTLTLTATNNLGDMVTGEGPATIYLEGQFTYTVTNGTVTITGYAGVGGEMIIPSTINGLTVSDIGLYAFNEKGLTSVFIPASVISLEEGAFQYNDGLSVYFEGDAPSADDTVFMFSSATAHYLPGTTGWTAFSANTGIAAVELAGIGITATPSSGAPPLAVSFASPNIDSAGNTISNWNWAFGDGGTSTTQNPSHTYTKTGIFSVALVENNSSGLPVAEATTIVTVSAPSTLAFTAKPTNGYVPLTVFFTSPGVDVGGNTIANWNWSFGDGQTSGAQNPFHTYTNTGTFSLSLTATNNLGATLTGYGPGSVVVASEFVYGTANKTITITGYAGSAGALTIPSTIDGLPVTSIAEYAFAGGAGLTSLTIPGGLTNIGPGAFQNNPLTSVYFEGNEPIPNVEVFFNTSLKAIYYLPGTTGWGSTFDNVTTVGLAGVATNATPASGAAPLTVSFTAANVDSGGNGISGWNWNFGDGSTGTGQNPSHTYYAAGAFTPLLIAINGNGTPIAGSLMSVQVSPPLAAGPAPIPLEIRLNGGSVVLIWNDPASAFSLQAAPAAAGFFTTVPNATPPYTNIITGAQQFFRLMANSP